MIRWFFHRILLLTNLVGYMSALNKIPRCAVCETGMIQNAHVSWAYLLSNKTIIFGGTQFKGMRVLPKNAFVSVPLIQVGIWILKCTGVLLFRKKSILVHAWECGYECVNHKSSYYTLQSTHFHVYSKLTCLCNKIIQLGLRAESDIVAYSNNIASRYILVKQHQSISWMFAYRRIPYPFVQIK